MNMAGHRAGERAAIAARNRALTQRVVDQLQWWCSLELSPAQYAEVFESQRIGRRLELTELVVMMKTGCSLADARKHVATQVPCPGRDQCTGCPEHAAELFEELLAARRASRT